MHQKHNFWFGFRKNKPSTTFTYETASDEDDERLNMDDVTPTNRNKVTS